MSNPTQDALQSAAGMGETLPPATAEDVAEARKDPRWKYANAGLADALIDIAILRRLLRAAPQGESNEVIAAANVILNTPFPPSDPARILARFALATLEGRGGQSEVTHG